MYQVSIYFLLNVKQELLKLTNLKNKLSLSLILLFLSLLSKSQDTIYFIGNSAAIGIGIKQGNYKAWPYKGDDWSLEPSHKSFVAEYQANAGKLFKPLSKLYSAFVESGLRVGYQSGKITNGFEKANYSETYIGLPVALGVLKKTNHKILKHTLGFVLYGSVPEEVKMTSVSDKKWGFFSQPRGMVFLNTHILFSSKKSGRYRGVGVEISKDLRFNYKSTAIPFAIENMRLGITLSPFSDFF